MCVKNTLFTESTPNCLLKGFLCDCPSVIFTRKVEFHGELLPSALVGADCCNSYDKNTYLGTRITELDNSLHFSIRPKGLLIGLERKLGI